MKIDLSLYSPEMDSSLSYDHAPCPECGAIDKRSAQRLCAGKKKVESCGWSRRLVSCDVNGNFCAPIPGNISPGNP